MIESNKIAQAIRDKEFTIFYQPKIQIIDGKKKIICYEALCRWKDIPPNDFFSAIFLDRIMFTLSLYNAAAIAKDLRDYPELFRVSINLSPRELADSGHLWRILNILKDFVVPLRIKFEFTEDAAMDDVAIANIERIKRLGIQISLDDFGAAYNSNICKFLELPINEVKFDRSIVSRCDRFAYRKFLEKMTAFFQGDLGIDVTAEGVETESEMEILEEIGISRFQGYLFARPSRPSDLFRQPSHC